MIAYALDPLKDARHKTARAARDCADWLAWLELEGKAERTLDDYERTVAALLRTYEETAVDEFTSSDVDHFLRTFPSKSRRIRRAHLSSFFRWAYRMERIERNPMDRVPTQRRQATQLIETFDEAEISLLTGLPSPDGALFLLLFDTGIRRAEAIAAQVRHADLSRGEFAVPRGKGGKGRVVTMTSRLVGALDAMVTLEGLDRGDTLFYSKPGGGNVRAPAREGGFRRWYIRCLEAAGVRYRHPHTTRHTFATRCLQAGIPLEQVSLLMGHASIKTTFDLYAHLDLNDLRTSMALLEAAVSK